jgi:glutathione synthase/RimK-type ligase-like ATP-grasp enzyme
MKNLAVLTDSLHPNLIQDDQVLFAAFESQGIKLIPIIWDQSDWSLYQNILIRSPWDYALKRDLFIQKVKECSRKNVNLIHSPEIVLWNIDKSYLANFSGPSTIATLIFDNFIFENLDLAFAKLGPELVLKPKVGAGGKDTYRLSSVAEKEKCQNLLGKSVIIQPFIESVVTEGEYSFIYFGRQFSHAILKKAKSGEFRVQDDHGGSVYAYTPTQAELHEVDQILASLHFKTDYARVDVVRGSNHFLVMEIELIEPELFFRFSREAPLRFATYINHKLR